MNDEDANLPRNEGAAQHAIGAMNTTADIFSAKEDPIGSAEIRAARGFLSWTARELAERAGVSFSTVRRIEDADGKPVRKRSIDAIRTALEGEGIRFVRSADGSSGMLFTTTAPRQDA